MNNEQKLAFITKVIGTGFIIAILYHLVMRFYFKLGYPYATFLFRPNDNFMDFINPYRIAIGSPFLIFASYTAYFPLYDAIMKIFRLIGSEKIALIIYLISFLSAFTIILTKQFFSGKDWHIFILILVLCAFSYPMLFSIQRANLEILVFVFISLFIYFYKKNEFLSVIFLSIAIAVKPFPAVFLILLLLDKRYKDIIFSIILTICLTLFGLLILPGKLFINLEGWSNNLSLYTQVYTIGNEGLYFGNSLWGAMKYVIMGLFPFVKMDYSILLKPYLFFAILIFGALVFYLYKNPISFEKKITLLICAMDLLPYVSADYKLIYFYIPLVMFVNNGVSTKKDWLYALLLGLIFVPKAYLNLPNYPEASISILLNPVLMILLSVMIILSQKTRLITNE